MEGTFASTPAPETVATLPLAGGNVFAMTVSLLLVVAAIFAVAWVMKRVQGKHRATGGTLEILDVLPVGPKERIVLVRAGNAQVLLGMTPGRISPLQVLDRPLSADTAAPSGADPVLELVT